MSMQLGLWPLPALRLHHGRTLQQLPVILLRNQWAVNPFKRTYLFHALHLAFFLFQVLLLLLASLVDPPDKAFDIALVAHAVLVLLARGRIVCDVDVAVLAKVLFLGDPILAHGGDDYR